MEQLSLNRTILQQMFLVNNAVCAQLINFIKGKRATKVIQPKTEFKGDGALGNSSSRTE